MAKPLTASQKAAVAAEKARQAAAAAKKNKPKPAPSAGRRVNPKAAKPKPAPKPASAKSATPKAGPKPYQVSDPWAGPKRASIGNVKPGAATNPKRPPQMVNSNSATMRQIQAKADAARARAQGKPGIKGPINPPNSARAGTDLIRQGANRLRNLADSGQVRAAAQRGQQAVEAAKRNRARLAAGVGRGAKEVAALKGGLSALRSGAGAAGGTDMLLQGSQMLRGAMERAGFKPPAGSRSQAEIAQRRNPPAKPAAPKGPTPAQRTAYQTQETKARKALDARKKATGSKEATPNTAASFDDAFKDARRAKVKTFTWRGKKYTTEMK
jgi:colicin import membrane protein